LSRASEPIFQRLSCERRFFVRAFEKTQSIRHLRTNRRATFARQEANYISHFSITAFGIATPRALTIWCLTMTKPWRMKNGCAAMLA